MQHGVKRTLLYCIYFFSSSVIDLNFPYIERLFSFFFIPFRFRVVITQWECTLLITCWSINVEHFTTYTYIIYLYIILYRNTHKHNIINTMTKRTYIIKGSQQERMQISSTLYNALYYVLYMWIINIETDLRTWIELPITEIIIMIEKQWRKRTIILPIIPSKVLWIESYWSLYFCFVADRIYELVV